MAKWRIGCFGIVAVLVCIFAFFLAVKGFFDIDPASPYQVDNICFNRDYPGATERYTAFTPAKCNQPDLILGPAIGADHGVLSFSDIDNDGKPEMIVQSSSFRCRHSAMPCYDAWHYVVKVCPTCSPIFTVIEQTYLPELVAK